MNEKIPDFSFYCILFLQFPTFMEMGFVGEKLTTAQKTLKADFTKPLLSDTFFFSF